MQRQGSPTGARNAAVQMHELRLRSLALWSGPANDLDRPPNCQRSPPNRNHWLVHAGPGHKRRQPLLELQRAQHQVRGAVAPRGFELPLTGGADLYPRGGQCLSGDVSAKVLLPLALVSFDTHGYVSLCPLRFSNTGALAPRPRVPQRQYLLPGARPEGDSVRDGDGLHWPEGARSIPVGVGLGLRKQPHCRAVAARH
jgi:hypothetical protein